MDFDAFRLAAATADLGVEPAARAEADLLEFRMDMAADPADALGAYDGELPLLVTNRAAFEGGGADGAGRLDLLAAACEHDAVVAVDVELASVQDGDADAVLDAARDSSVSVVVSAHDFQGTPTRSAMEATLRSACEHGDVGKLAVTATDRGDTLDVLAVTHAMTEAGERVATMAMGEPGRHTRALAPLYGSKVGYAPVDPDDATAPGQYDLSTLASLVDALSGAATDQTH
jgi:3-dehydroquinate dehydratase-1